MLVFSHKTSRRGHRVKTLLVLFAAAVVVFVLISSKDNLTGIYRNWRQQRSIGEAKEFIKNDDSNNALLAVQVAVQANPQNPAAWKVAADFLENAGVSDAVRIRQQILASEPNVLANRIALAATALRFQNLSIAEDALNSVPVNQRHSADYQKPLDAYALATKQCDKADEAIATVLEIEPDNQQMKFNRETIRLRHPNDEIADAARRQVVEFAQKVGPLQLSALRELIGYETRHKHLDLAITWADKLVNQKEATFGDFLLQANLYKISRPNDMVAIVAGLQTRAAKDPNSASQLALWFSVQGGAKNARDWLESLPADIRGQPAIQNELTNCYAALKNWDKVSEMVENGAWGKVPPESIRLAMSAHLMSDRQRLELRRNIWQEDLTLSKNNLPALRALLRLGSYWGWENEATETLFTIAKNFPGESWAIQTLITNAYLKKDTVTLKNAYTLWHETQPATSKVQGDWAMLTLLTESSATPNAAKEKAKALYETDPKKPYFTTTYAFSLHQLGKPKEALKVIATLSPAELKIPGRALYYGLLLSENGQSATAERYLALAAKAELLPSHHDLLTTAPAQHHT